MKILLILLCVAYCDPIVYEETASDDRWVKVMEEEIHTIEKNDT